jgi:hypothetical protein
MEPEQMVVSQEEKNMAMFCHLAALAGYIFPFGNIIGPLILWQMKKEEMPLVDDQGKEAVNFQISITLYCIVAGILIIVLIGIPILIGLLIFDLVAIVLATIRTNDGKLYRYPLSIRFLK